MSNDKVAATFHGADSVAKGDARYPTPEEEYAWAEGQRYDYLDVLRQRDEARDEVARLTATLNRVRALCDAQGDYVMVYALRSVLDGSAPADPDEQALDVQLLGHRFDAMPEPTPAQARRIIDAPPRPWIDPDEQETP